ncbi:MAG: exosortase system-associated protein, TIGR04073 family [Candidatus Omnitrophica bacterium]|nr:exosortase system-associated protein, TIGR04073 family [Candidatus Omnitrophota bacterium]
MSTKRLMGFLLLFIFLTSAAARASYTEGVAQKLGRGVGNVIYSPLEIPLRVDHEITSDDYVYGVPKGALKGIVYAVGRLTVGAYEVATFPIPQDQIISNFNQD